MGCQSHKLLERQSLVLLAIRIFSLVVRRLKYHNKYFRLRITFWYHSRMNKLLFTDEEYGKVLDNIVVACVDVAVTHQGSILLEKREFMPIKDEWWIFGGRMLVGESFKETARRSVFRELGVDIEDTNRFSETGTFNLRWPTRREPISENGCHHLLIAHTVEVSNEEKEIIDAFTKNKQDVIGWFDMRNHDLDLLPEIQSIIQKIM